MGTYIKISGDTPPEWNAFDPDALGALIEVYTWLTQPAAFRSGFLNAPDVLEYRTHRYNALTEMLLLAIAKERERLKQSADLETCITNGEK